VIKVKRLFVPGWLACVSGGCKRLVGGLQIGCQKMSWTGLTLVVDISRRLAFYCLGCLALSCAVGRSFNTRKSTDFDTMGRQTTMKDLMPGSRPHGVQAEAAPSSCTLSGIENDHPICAEWQKIYLSLAWALQRSGELKPGCPGGMWLVHGGRVVRSNASRSRPSVCS